MVDYSKWDNFNSSDDEQEPTAQQRDARGPSPSTAGEGGEDGGGKKKKRKTAKKGKAQRATTPATLMRGKDTRAAKQRPQI